MNAKFLIFLLCSVVLIFNANAKQVISCHKPEVTLSFDEKNYKNRNTSSFNVPALSLTGKVTQVWATTSYVHFKKADIPSAVLRIPKLIIGKKSADFKAKYSYWTPDGFWSTGFDIHCSSILN